MMILDDRKRRILQAIVEDFVSTGEPVGSRTVAKKYSLGMSAATIRNDMADLEEMGLIHQPHTSAGRVPSDLGYREYVDKIMKLSNLSTEEALTIRDKLVCRLKDISQLIKQVSNVISQSTSYTSVAVAPRLINSKIRHLQLVPIDKNKVLLVLVVNDGTVRNFMVKVNKEFSPDFLFAVSNLLNDKFSGLPLGEIDQGLAEKIKKEYLTQEGVLEQVVDVIRQKAYSPESVEVFLEGTSNILNFPEFSDVSRAKEFLEFLDERNSLISLLSTETNDEVKVTIGSENTFDEFKGCSVVTASYWIGDKLLGNIGVIGPTRMNYARVISCMEFLRKELNDILRNIDHE